MTRNIYALLVGIDRYIAPVPALRGCVNDVEAVKDYLQHRVDGNGYQLNLQILLDEEATRQAVIHGFRNHLSQAGSNDVAFFYYSGHGSQEPCPPELWHLEPDRLNETIVCWDSRSEGSWDLADKELAKLVAEVAEKNPHIVLVMDCCHSGSASRDTQFSSTRTAPVSHRQRPLDSFIFLEQEAITLAPATRSVGQNSTGWVIPRGRHILMAACRDSEEAKEYYGSEKPRGAFCYCLLETLKQASGSLTYRDLFKRTEALIRSKTTAQTPQLDQTDEDLDQPFLGGAIVERVPHFTAYYQPGDGWVIDGSNSQYGNSASIGRDV